MRSQLLVQERRARMAEHLAAAIAAISASLDVQTTVGKVAEQTAYVLQLGRAAVYLFDAAEKAGTLHWWSRTRQEQAYVPQKLAALLATTEALTMVRERGEPAIINDVGAAPSMPQALIAQLDMHALALLPLTTARGIIGCIVAPHSEVHQWSVDEVRVGLTLAAHAATAIENARLFDALQQHNHCSDTLNTVAQVLGGLHDPSQHLDLVLERIVTAMDLDAGVVVLRDGHSAALHLTTHYGLPVNVEDPTMEYPLELLYELARRVVVSGALRLGGTTHNGDGRNVWLDTVGFRELMAVPLDSSSPIVGVLMVGSYNRRELAAADLALLTTIGQQVGLALKNEQLLRSASEMEALHEADRLKSEFLTAVSHDLRSPLTAIRTSVESLIDEGNVLSPAAQSQLLQTMAGQTWRLDHLVDQLLDLSRIKAGAFALDRDWTELGSLIADTLTRFEALHPTCHILRQIAVDLPLHYVDPDRLVQVLWNLLENANKYAPPHSLVVVEAQVIGAEVLLGVADRGPGVPPSERERIFQHFYRLDKGEQSHAPGSGLGLAICRGIVEAHGGRIWVEERLGGGSLFRVALPVPSHELDEAEMLEMLPAVQ